MAVETLFLSSYEFNRFLQYKSYVEAFYNISINLPDVRAPTLQDILSNDVLLIQLNGPENAVAAASKFISSSIAPEETVPFYFPPELRCIFRNTTWLRILSKIHHVDIKMQSDIERLLVSGRKSHISNVFTAMEILNCTFRSSPAEVGVCSEGELRLNIPSDLCVPPVVKSCYHAVQHLPIAVIDLLLSWIKELLASDVTKSADVSVITLDDSLADQSVIIVETPPKQISLITLSDDEDNDTNNNDNRLADNNDIHSQMNNGEQVSTSNQSHGNGNRVLTAKRMVNRNFFPSDKNWVAPNLKVGRKNRKRKRALLKGINFEMQNLNIENKKAKRQNEEACVASTSAINQPNTSRFNHFNNTRNKSANPTCTVSKAEDSLSFIAVTLQPGIGQRTVTASVPQPVPTVKRALRPIVIDGSNVARSHGERENVYSCRGIELCIQYFLNKGHTEVVAFVPQHRRKRQNQNIRGHDILEKLASSQHVVFTPSRTIQGQGISSYDDRFIVRLAADNGGVIVSNDLFRDIMHEKPEWTTTIEQRLLMYCFVGDRFMIPDDPLGKNGPRIDEFLSFPAPLNV